MSLPLTSLGWLSFAEMRDADRLYFAPRFANDSYDNEAVVAGNAPGADWFPLYSWSGVAGAVYTVTSSSYYDPDNLVIYDADGRPLAQDDGTDAPGTDGVTFVAPYTGIYYVDASWVQGSTAPNRGVTLGIYEDIDTVPVKVGNGTNGDDAITGTVSNDALYGFDGNDILIGAGGNDLLDGGNGTDTALYEGKLAEYDVVASGARIFVTDHVGLDGRDTLVSVERVEFADFGLAFDTDGVGGQAYRLYQAAFDRVPDAGGLGYWIDLMEHGFSLDAVAEGFATSAEFRDLYGSRPGNAALVNGLYENVLHRAPDAEGMAYWLDILNSGASTMAGVLVSFSESAENHAQVIGQMQQGMLYQPVG